MIDLDLLGVGADEETLVFTDSEGHRYTTPITDELRGAVRRDRPRIEAITEDKPLRPREIQALLRSGARAVDIAREHNVEVSQITRYEAPVQAEKDYALSRALSSHIGSLPDSPVMGDLVVDRLAARGVSPDSLNWSASRQPDSPWVIQLTFVQGAVEHGAQWRLPSSGHLEAIDEEARWLTETASPTGVQTFAALPTPAPLPTADEDDMQQREALIDQLNSQRGKPQEIEYDIDEDEEDEDLPHLPAGVESLAARIHSLTEARRSSTQADEETQSGAQTNEPPLPLEQLEDVPSAPAPKKSKRRSVPSWDEIVFGSRA
jgi:putative DNA-binding protein